jgi:hypothetical protein
MKSVRLVQLGAPLQDVELATPEIASADVLSVSRRAASATPTRIIAPGISPIAHCLSRPATKSPGRWKRSAATSLPFRAGDRVCVHYLAHCGACDFCLRGSRAILPRVQMIGKHRDGGYAEFIKVPARSLFALPEESDSRKARS